MDARQKPNSIYVRTLFLLVWIGSVCVVLFERRSASGAACQLRGAVDVVVVVVVAPPTTCVGCWVESQVMF